MHTHTHQHRHTHTHTHKHTHTYIYIYIYIVHKYINKYKHIKHVNKNIKIQMSI